MDSETEDVALDEMVGNYVKLRDKIKAVDAAFKERTEKARQLLEEANLAILGRLQALKAQNVKTAHGTAYRTTRKSATVADGSDVPGSSWAVDNATGL